MAERNQANRPQKRFKTSAPKGVRLGSGYVDRSKERSEEEADDREERLKALEKSYKDEEIDQETYERLRFQIAGGDLASTHLVKGLDFKLLKRIKEGEDVYGEKKEVEAAPDESEENVDDEFDMLETQEPQTSSDKPKAEKEKKKGQLSTVALAPGKKRTRDQILADLKAARKAAKEQQESALVNQGFKKIGAKQMPGTRIERDSKGREVMIIVDEDGHEKRKVRKVQPGEDKSELLMPDASAKPLGMEVPEQYRKVEEPEDDEDIDIFDDIGDDYDPLAGMDDGSDDDSGDEQSARKVKIPNDSTKATTKDEEDGAAMPPPPRPAQAAPRNYFSNSKTGLLSEEAEKAPSMSDPAIMAAIKKAAALNPIGKEDDEGSSEDDERENEKALQERRKRLLAASSRDDDDLDMGFGTSRFEDEEDFEESKVKLSKWGGDGDDGDERSGGKGKRKRGAKKRKGDANNADDVLRVMEQRKKAS
jgi:hypothetical protein